MGGSLVRTEDEDTDGASPDAASAFPSQLSAQPVQSPVTTSCDQQRQTGVDGGGGMDYTTLGVGGDRRAQTDC